MPWDQLALCRLPASGPWARASERLSQDGTDIRALRSCSCRVPAWAEL